MGYSTSAQTCSGILGENIFADGDFGRGSANVVQNNPNTAPGYSYERNPPPQDGEYTITNDMRSWNSANGWIRIGDRSNDANGYMMIINASYDPGLFYQKTITGLCENTIYEFSADIINIVPTGRNIIRPNVSFLIDGIDFFTTGNIPEDETWKTYGFLFKTKSNQTSVTLALQNNAPGGIGNDLALDNISFRACGPEISIKLDADVRICENGLPINLHADIDNAQAGNQVIQWQQRANAAEAWSDVPGAQDTLYTHTDLSAGNYFYRIILAPSINSLNNEKCRVSSELYELIVPPRMVTVFDTICHGSSSTIGTTKYTATGQYVTDLLSTFGCDSTVTLNLTVTPNPGYQFNYTTDDPQCYNTDDGFIDITSVTGGVPPVEYFINNEPFNAPNRFENLVPGSYRFKAIDDIGCRTDTTINIDNPSEFIVDIGDSLSIELGDYIFVRPRSISNYISRLNWLFNDEEFYCNKCWPLVWVPRETGVLKLVAENNRGCIATDSIKVNVDPVYKVYFPTAFSPNNDGINDGFTVFGHIPNINIIDELAVYNRWGNKVFEKKEFDPNEDISGWDGSYNGSVLSPDIYAYTARILFHDGNKVNYQGQVQLMK